MKIDAVDDLILEALQQDSDITNKALAERIAMSKSACSGRVGRLKRDRIILGCRAIINAKAIGAHFDAWVDIKLRDKTVETLGRFRSLIADTPAIVSAYHLAGEYEFLLRFLAASSEAWNDFHARVSAFGVAVARPSVVVDTVKADAPVCLTQSDRFATRLEPIWHGLSQAKPWTE